MHRSDTYRTRQERSLFFLCPTGECHVEGDSGTILPVEMVVDAVPVTLSTLPVCASDGDPGPFGENWVSFSMTQVVDLGFGLHRIEFDAVLTPFDAGDFASLADLSLTVLRTPLP